MCGSCPEGTILTMNRMSRDGLRRWMLVGSPVQEASDGVKVRRYRLARVHSAATPEGAQLRRLAGRRAAAA
jgi:hypothetical protein